MHIVNEHKKGVATHIFEKIIQNCSKQESDFGQFLQCFSKINIWHRCKDWIFVCVNLECVRHDETHYFFNAHFFIFELHMM